MYFGHVLSSSNSSQIFPSSLPDFIFSLSLSPPSQNYKKKIKLNQNK